MLLIVFLSHGGPEFPAKAVLAGFLDGITIGITRQNNFGGECDPIRQGNNPPITFWRVISPAFIKICLLERAKRAHSQSCLRFRCTSPTKTPLKYRNSCVRWNKSQNTKFGTTKQTAKLAAKAASPTPSICAMTAPVR